MTGAPILTQAVAGVRLAVEVAWGANLADLTGSSWTWTDITADVLMGADPAAGRDAVSITIGRADESSDTQPSLFTCRLDNRSARYSLGGVSANWPNVRRGTPVRCRVSTDSGATWSVKYQGNAVSWQPSWDDAGKFATVVLTASGPLRQLNQGTLPVSSYYAQTIPTSSLYAGLLYYWNNEGGNGYEGPDRIQACIPTVAPVGAGSAAYLVPDTSTAHFPNVVTTANSGAFPISGPLPSVWDFAAATLPATTSTGSLQFRFLCAISSLSGTQFQPLIYWKTSASASVVWSVNWDQDGNIFVKNSSGWTGALAGFAANNKAVMVQVQHTTNGSGSNVRVDFINQDGTSGGLTWTGATGSTCGYCTYVQFVGPNINSKDTPVMEGHMTIQNQLQNASTLATFIKGNPGESVTDRITRLCNAANVPLSVRTGGAETSSNPADVMGAQYYDTLTNLLRECEATGQGLLLDGLNNGLTYITRQGRESNGAIVTLDAAAGHLTGFAPIDDDQGVVNQATITHRESTNVTYTDTTSPLSASAIGVYSSAATVNPQDDVALPRYAQWAVHLGTICGYRYPQISFNLHEVPAQIPWWAILLPSSRLDVTNIVGLRAQHPGGPIRSVVEGWTETIDAFTWRVTANCTPWQGWNVGTMAASTGSTGDSVMRRDTDGSATNAAYSAGATSVAVKLTAAGKPLWTTAADDFPMVVSIGGTPVTVTAISGSASPQTFTLAAPGLPYPVAANAEVRLWNPPVLGM